MERKYSVDVGPSDQEVKVAGWAHEIRDIGKLVFVVLRDREGEVQVTFKQDEVDADMFERVKNLGRESVIEVTGTAVPSDQAPGGREIKPNTLNVLNEAESPLPLEVSGEIDSDLATRLDNRFIDLRKPHNHAIFSLKTKALDAMREWFNKEGYIEIDTPLISKGGAEGGADLFPVIYYQDEAFLSQSPQLYKQMLMSAGFDKVFEVGTAFRAEDFATSRHVSEIDMFDVELAFIDDHHDVMDVQEESLRYTLRHLKENAKDELDELGVELDVPEEDFPRITFEKAREILKEEFDHVPEDDDDLDTEGEKLLGEYFEEKGHPAFFVVGFPNEKFYYMQDVEGDEVASRKFDLIYKGQELTSGGQREHDMDTILDYMDRQGADESNFEFYLEAFKFGMPPHGGYGLGIDRLVQKIADLDNIKEAILFPRDPNRLEP
ncbi:MAG: aspartate--tRNA(Asn) ligase [Candidatus Nanohaloarchaeota archaeon QJJ-5]|nr:aspartate--tRNA(Asn) ligase [Candidatus Nanohaloarchaeota archaeon QJJ-5]